MPKLRRLNQTATFYTTNRTNQFGALQATGGEVVRCRYDITDGTYQDQRGMDVINTVGIHLDYLEDVREGSFFSLSNGLTYMVIQRHHTPGLNGQYFKTFCKLKEHFINVI